MFRKVLSTVFLLAAVSQANAQGVTPAESGPITAAAGSFAVGSLVDGADATQGTKTDTICTSPFTSCTAIQLLKAIANASGGSGGTVAQGSAASSNPWIFTPWIAGAVNSAGNPLYVQNTAGSAAIGSVTVSALPSIPAGSNLIGAVTPYQGGNAQSATNGGYVNILQGNAANSASNPYYFAPSTSAVFSVNESQYGGTFLTSTSSSTYGTAPTGTVPGVNAYVTSSSLPSGAATSALQTTENTNLTAINTTLGTPMQQTGGSVSIVTGTSAIGQVGSFNVSLSSQPTVSTSAYTSGYAIGGLQTVALFRNTTNPSATIANVGVESTGGSTASTTLYAFTKSPASTCTNAAAFSLSSTDAPYIIPGFPIVLNPQPQGVGSTASFANQQGPYPVSNHDTTATVNIYLCAVTAGYTPASTTDLTFTIGALRD